jgi:hypothetical protein
MQARRRETGTLELAAKRPNDPWDRFEQSSVTSARSTIAKGAVIVGLDGL